MTTSDIATGIEYDTLEKESAILDLFEQMKNPNPKKVRKLAARLYGECTLEIQKRLCRDIYRADNPVKYMRSCIDKIRDCAILVEQFIEDGCHGMIFTGKDGTEVWPIKLDTRENWLTEGKDWHPEQEQLIQHDAVDAWMREHDKGYFYGKVVLFPKFGFSGEPRIIEMKCGADTEGMVRYPGTKYYVTPDVVHDKRTLNEAASAQIQHNGANKSLVELFHLTRT